MPRHKNKPNMNDVGIATLTSHKDIYMLIYMLESLIYYSKTNYKIFICSDGTLTKLDKFILNSIFDCKIVEKERLDFLMSRKIKKYEYLKKYRFNEKISLTRLKLDSVILSPFKKFIYIDSDILFLNQPEEILNWIKSRNGACRYTVHLENFFNEQFYPEFSFRLLFYKHLDISMSPGFSSGILLLTSLNSEELTLLNKIAKMLDSYNWISFGAAEETIFSVFFDKKGGKPLSTKNYAIFSLLTEKNYYETSINAKNIHMKHFGYETKHLFRKEAIKEAIRTSCFKIK